MSDAVIPLVASQCGQAIEPPTGEALREVLLGMHTIPDEGIDAQILRW
jgi:hypothetical protein